MKIKVSILYNYNDHIVRVVKDKLVTEVNISKIGYGLKKYDLKYLISKLKCNFHHHEIVFILVLLTFELNKLNEADNFRKMSNNLKGRHYIKYQQQYIDLHGKLNLYS